MHHEILYQWQRLFCTELQALENHNIRYTCDIWDVPSSDAGRYVTWNDTQFQTF